MRLPIDPEVRNRVDRIELPRNEFGIDPYGISKWRQCLDHSGYSS